MTATSTTSPKSEQTLENEKRDIQKALDKKRKKKRKPSGSKDSKLYKIEGYILRF